MSTITREQLRARAREKVKSLEFSITQTAFADSRAELEEELELARIALASLEAEAVAYIFKHPAGRLFWALTDESNKGQSDVMPVYTAPPAPVSVPDEHIPCDLENEWGMVDEFNKKSHLPDEKVKGDDFELDGPLSCYQAGKIDGWNEYRAAMLQGAEPVTTAYKLPEGWVAVPVEPTEDMIVNGFESEPDESFSDEKEWEAYEAMSGCQQAAHRARLCWSAMIASRPKLKHDLT
ncbi:hypothetical protein EGK38_007220 [Enterobacter hormaechei]|uniref:hypothetical protein n=1 Tax=Enterobacter hormaechei TaxID=158836 RepID=UPI001639C888|nr:hypothetical protein [Enterobacter hormaechei]QXR32978.1 hypothetical protein EGK38_007220 [Enterobacter hormaechei]